MRYSEKNDVVYLGVPRAGIRGANTGIVGVGTWRLYGTRIAR